MNEQIIPILVIVSMVTAISLIMANYRRKKSHSSLYSICIFEASGGFRSRYIHKDSSNFIITKKIVESVERYTLYTTTIAEPNRRIPVHHWNYDFNKMVPLLRNYNTLAEAESIQKKFEDCVEHNK